MMNTIQNSKIQSGFTLIETVTYIALFLFVAVGSLVVVVSAQDILGQYQAKQQLFVSSTTVMEHLLLELREAEAVIETESVFADSAGTLMLATASGTKQFVREDNSLQLIETDGSVLVLSPESVNVTGFTIYHYTGEQSEFVRIELTMEADLFNYVEQFTLRSGAVIRGTYVYEE